MRSIRDIVLLVLRIRPQQLEHGPLGGLIGKDDVMATVYHEGGSPDPSDEVGRVNLRHELRGS